MKTNRFSFHSTCVGSGSILTLIGAAKSAGFDCIEPNIVQVDAFFDAGYTAGEFHRSAQGLDVAALGWIANCERQGEAQKALLLEARAIFEKAAAIGAKSVQVINGPTDYRAVVAYHAGAPFSGYSGLLDMDIDEQVRLTVKNLAVLADLAAQYQLVLYFEPLCWTPLGSIRQGVRICEAVGKPNLKIMIDFWHGYVAGDKPEDISRIPPELICGVHICDGRSYDGGVPNEMDIRNVPYGCGVIPIAEWVDAVKTTGYRGWWAYETFSKRERQADPYVEAPIILSRLQQLIGEEK